MLRGVIFARRCFWLCQRETADGKASVRWWEAGMEKRAAHRYQAWIKGSRIAEKEIIAMTTGLPDFFKYNLWANLRLLDACAQLSDAQLDATMTGTFGSVRETLLHLFAAEEGYVQSFTGTTPTPPLKELTTFPGFDELRRCAERS